MRPSERAQLISELPGWAQVLLADYLKVEMNDDKHMFKTPTAEDTRRAFDMMIRCYVSGFRDRTKGLRALPKLRDDSEVQHTSAPRKGPPPLPPQGPYSKGR